MLKKPTDYSLGDLGGLGDLSFLSTLYDQSAPSRSEVPEMPERLSRFLRDGIRPSDDPRDIVTLAFELARFWQSSWAQEFRRRAEVERELAKLKTKRPRGRPRELMDLAELAPKKRGRHQVWDADLYRKLLAVAEREREKLQRKGRAKVTDLEALTAFFKLNYADEGISDS
jgi:hypothetical protein